MSGFIINENILDEELSEKKQDPKLLKKKKKLDIVIYLLIAVIVICLFFIGRYFWQSFKNDDFNEELAGQAVDYGSSSEDFGSVGNDSSATESSSNKGGSGGKKKEIKVPQSIDFEKLKAQNKDVVGWIFSKNGVINYPILQGKDNSYYLNHLISGKKNMNGSIFMDYSANKNFKDVNTIIYGHSMDNGSMFRTLLNYKKQSYYDKYPEMYFYTPNSDYKLLIFAAYETKSNDLAYGKIYSDKGFDKLLSHVKSKSKIKTDVSVGKGDKLVTLSTCAYSSKNARFIVIGKLVPANFKSDDNTENSSDTVSSNDSSSGYATIFGN